MASRRSGGVAEDLLEIAAKLPWWLDCAIALLTYALLHGYAATEVGPAPRPGQIAPFVIGHAGRSLASVGQFLVPFLFLVGAAVSFLGRMKREALLRGASQGRNSSDLLALSWRDFELLIGEYFRQRGFRVVETGGAGSDGGIDLKLRKDGELFLVQCKQWRAQKVAVTVVRELYGVMAAEGAAGGFVVTSGTFTNEAGAFAKGRNIALLDGARLARLLRPSGATRQASTPAAATASRATHDQTEASPPCPRCGGVMLKRVAKQGANAGRAFWGCATFPDCRGIRSIDLPV